MPVASIVPGQVAEWFKAHAWKACGGATHSRVRIPPCPLWCSRFHRTPGSDSLGDPLAWFGSLLVPWIIAGLRLAAMCLRLTAVSMIDNADAEFIRRVTLDVAGSLPTPQEVRDFLADASSDKRDKVVDRLLASDRYAIFWASKWGDWLRNKQADQNYKDSAVKFGDWIRQSFAANMPFA